MRRLRYKITEALPRISSATVSLNMPAEIRLSSRSESSARRSSGLLVTAQPRRRPANDQTLDMDAVTMALSYRSITGLGVLIRLSKQTVDLVAEYPRVVFACDLDNRLERIGVEQGARGVVRVIDADELGIVGHQGIERVDVDVVAVLGIELKDIDLRNVTSRESSKAAGRWA